MHQTFMIVSTGILVLFAHLSLFDGLYFHLWKFRLQERSESKFEHLTHTARALLFIPTLVLIYMLGLQGPLLWIGVVVLALDLLIEAVDLLEEHQSRAQIGGLPSCEYFLHVVLTTLRVAALTLALAALPPEAWFSHESAQVSPPAAVQAIAKMLLPGAVAIAALHVYLIFDPRLISRIQRSLTLNCCER